MKTFFCKLMSQFLVVSMILLPYSTQAALIGTGDVVAGAQAQTSRDKLNVFMARADVQRQLQSLGLDPQTAKDRVSALTDQEVEHLAGKIDSLPAGAFGGWEAAGVIVMILILLYVFVK